jgi:hypothetical protein
MYNVLKILFTGVVLIMLSGCNSGIKGNGEIVSEHREVASFNQIKLSGGYIIDISQGEKQSVELTGESNILPLIETKIDDDTLTIGCKKDISINPSQDLKIKITTPDIQSLSISGSAKGKISDINNRDFNLEISGSSKIDVQGKSKNMKINISGSGDINAKDMAITGSNIKISGSGKVTLGEVKELNVNIAGSGKIYYGGNPKISQKIAGSGSLIKL